MIIIAFVILAIAMFIISCWLESARSAIKELQKQNEQLQLDFKAVYRHTFAIYVRVNSLRTALQQLAEKVEHKK